MRVALVHDYLTQHGGAERVLEVLHDLFPEAPVFTSFADLAALPDSYRSWEIRQSSFARLPRASKLHRGLLPAYPAIFGRFADELRAFDVVLADSSAWSHQAPARSDAVHVCYCHSPARFLYRDQGYLAPSGMAAPIRMVAPSMFAMLRWLDRRAAARVDRYIANSRTVARRIRGAYGRDATIVYPPVDLDRFTANGAAPEPESWYLVVSRLVPHKRVDLAVDACSRAGLPLKVIGSGRAVEALRRRAGPSIEFLGRVDDDTVTDYLRRCRAFVLPAAEDFGMTAIEAQAAGRPVIAFGAGGALESVVAGETGVFFYQQTPEALLAAIDQFERRRWDPRRSLENATRFGKVRFLAEITAEVEAAIAAKRGIGDRG